MNSANSHPASRRPSDCRRWRSLWRSSRGMLGIATARSAHGDDAHAESFSRIASGRCSRGCACAAMARKNKAAGCGSTRARLWSKAATAGRRLTRIDLDQSLILEAIRRIEDVAAMPPDKRSVPQQVADLAAWVKAGRPGPSKALESRPRTHWAFQPIRDVVPPAVRDERWVQIEHRPLHSGAARGARAEAGAAGGPANPAAASDIRLDGVAADCDEVVAFERDTSPRAFEKVVDRLLGFAALRRALGTALAGCRSLCRHGR